ncbi:transcription initiation factor IIB family protein [Halobium salinum]|uniref:Transcription initiation factor IIB n=1 Tax=Halobium salinum TaxID=1364940 RepID=A0ABD5PAD3_9EURY|nr:transcription initiation factor IIB [Halobium salinum]
MSESVRERGGRADRSEPERADRADADHPGRTAGTEETTDAAGVDPEDLDPDELTRTAEGELVHEETGLVVDEDRVDRGPEWRAFDQSERDSKSRVGSPLTKARHDEGLTTEIGWRDEDANGRALSQEKRRRMQRLRTWQDRIRTQDAGERNLQFALGEVARMCSALGVPDGVREMAAVVYRRALDEDLIRGRSIEAMATAALYAACREQGVPRSLDELGNASRVGRDEVGRAYRYVSQELGLEVAPADPADYVPRYCSELDLSETVVRTAEELVGAAAEEGLHAGKSPTGYAAGAVYLASMLCDEKRTQNEVAEVADVTEVTVRNGYQEQLQVADGVA